MVKYRILFKYWGWGAICLLLAACSAGQSSRDVTSDLTRESPGNAPAAPTRDVASDLTRDTPQPSEADPADTPDGREFTSAIRRESASPAASSDTGATGAAAPASAKPAPVSPKVSQSTTASSLPPKPRLPAASDVFLREEYGKASYYGGKFHGRRTASGEIYDQNQLTAAHPTLPFGTVCRVTNLANGRQVIVRINDRGPFIKGRILDLSYRAAQMLDAIGAGVIEVRVEVLRYGKNNSL
ncbi:MAG: septal ring lytic transglycosylase RlpA family protein [Calditrichaeota bacterium]|nr:MAG: septal ring lytic transglycosylase RlpA family protein [Calditrichota bacterium]